MIITPVKDSVDTAFKTIQRVCESKGDFSYLVYNDRSLPENRVLLNENQKLGYSLINIEDYVETPSPNYRFTLIDARKKALEKNAHLLIVESDVFVAPDTISGLLKIAVTEKDCGMAAAITTNELGEINFPYLHIKETSGGIIQTNHRVSFCCTLLSYNLLSAVDFNLLSESKDWFDVQISKESRIRGFKNLIDTNLKVIHLPHSSRPWKKLKYEKPLKYYFRKFFLKLDKI